MGINKARGFILLLTGLTLLVLVVGLVLIVAFRPTVTSCPPFAGERLSQIQVVGPTEEDDEWLLGCGFIPDVGRP